MIEDEDLLYAVRSIRPHLPQLLDEAELAALLPKLDQLLDEAAHGENVTSLLIRELRKYTRVRTWLAQSVEQEGIRKDYSGLPGPITPIAAGDLYRCPIPGCDFEYRIRRAGQTVPTCIIHENVGLIKA